MSPASMRHLTIAASLLLLINGTQAKPSSALANPEPAISTSEHRVAPTAFEENKGQVRTTAGDVAPFVRYRLTQGNTSIFLLGNGIAYQFNRMHYPEGYAALQQDERLDPTKQQELDALRKEVRLETYRMDMLLEGANTNARITTEGRSDDYTQYYTHDALDIHTYSRVTYHEVYPGIDWVVYTTAKGMKYDFVLRPGADPSRIQLRFKDHEELYVDADGRLIHGNRMGRFTEERTVSFQDGREVGTRFVLEGDRLRFALNAYDRSQSLTIDPDRIWATYYGGTGLDQGNSCAVDGNDNVYLAGTSTSTAGIASSGHQNTVAGAEDTFLVKFNSSGQRQWSTYYGGETYDYGYACTVDITGNIYLTGGTYSATGIAFEGHQNTSGGAMDAFLVKFNANGERQWATYYGGTGRDEGRSCSLDGSGNVYLAGSTASASAMAIGAHQATFGGGTNDAFLVKFDADGVRQWGTYYGGTGIEFAYSCSVDDSGNVYLAGASTSSDSIAFMGHKNTLGGTADAFLVKFNAEGVRQWGTYYGGDDWDEGFSCSVDGSGNVYLAGYARSTNEIASGGHQNTYGGDSDGFLVKFNGNGVRQWGTYYGGIGKDQCHSSAVDENGNVYVAGRTVSVSGISTGGQQGMTLGILDDAFFVKFNPNGQRQWGAYYGGSSYDWSNACAVDGSGSVYLAGETVSTSDIALGGHQNTDGGGSDAFLAKFEAVPVGISDPSSRDPQHALSIWPNPNTGDRFYLRAQETGLAEVQLFDAVGKLQGTEQLQLSPGQTPVVVRLGSELAKGLYMVRVTVEGRSSVAPLVIE